MNRRDILRSLLGAGVAVTALPAIGRQRASVLQASPALNTLHTLTAGTDKVLVLIQLTGGNDGLNTLVPVESQEYYDARPTIAIAKNDTLPFVDGLGLHPALGGFRSLWQDGMMSVVHGVSYPDPNRSHFRGTDIWTTATDSNVFESTGWIGRLLRNDNPGYPEVLPDDPVAVQIGTSASLAFESDAGSLAVMFRDPQEFWELVGNAGNLDSSGSLPDTPAGNELAYLRTIAAASRLYSQRVKDSADAGTNTVEYPQGNNLAESLRVVARLISGGLTTPVYLVSISGNAFDTHAGQLTRHADLLQELGDAVKTFFDDLKKSGHHERVAAMTFSEFGRRVEENGSEGTDHGTAAPLFVFGPGVHQQRIHGSIPNLAAAALDDRGDIAMQYDYREIYSSVLSQWFLRPQSDIDVALLRSFSTLPIFRNQTTDVVDPLSAAPAVTLWPQPAVETCTASFYAPGADDALITIRDLRGSVVATFNAPGMAGHRTVPIRLPSVAPGAYALEISVGRMRTTSILHIVR